MPRTGSRRHADQRHKRPRNHMDNTRQTAKLKNPQTTLENQPQRSAMPFCRPIRRPRPHQPVPEVGRDGCQTRAAQPAAFEWPVCPQADIRGRRRGNPERDVSGVPRPGPGPVVASINGSSTGHTWPMGAPPHGWPVVAYSRQQVVGYSRRERSSRRDLSSRPAPGPRPPPRSTS